MFKTVRVQLAGIEKTVPLELLSAMKSFGWKEVSGAISVDAKPVEPKTQQASTRKKKDKV
jgi:hypothetical protein